MKYNLLKNLGYSLVGVGLLYRTAFARSGSNSSDITGSNDGGVGYTTLQNPIKAKTFQALISDLIDFVLFLAVPFLVIAIIWVGFTFVMAQGNAGKLKDARNNLLWTLIGAAIIIGVKLIQEVLTGTIGAITG